MYELKHLSPSGSVASFVVNPAGSSYTTIQSAIDDAILVASQSNPQTIVIFSGTYTEDLTISGCINLVSLGNGTFINGTIAFTPDASGDICNFNGNLYYSGISIANFDSKIGSTIVTPRVPAFQVGSSISFDCGNTEFVPPKTYNTGIKTLSSVSASTWANDILISLPISNANWKVEYSINTNYALNMGWATIQPALYDTTRIPLNIFNNSANSVSSITQF